MTTDRYKAFWLGVFVIMTICVVAWLFLFLKPTVGDGKVKLRIRFTNVEGVTIGTRITFGGKAVGSVTAIKELPDARSGKVSPDGTFYFYEVSAKVDSRVKVFSYDEIAYTTQGLLGEKSIEITPQATPKGAPPAQNITKEILYADSSDQLESALKQLQSAAATMEKTLERVYAIVDTGKIEETLDSIDAAAKEVTQLVDAARAVDLPGQVAYAASELAEAMGKADVVFSEIIDAHLVEKIASTASQIESISHKVDRGEGTLGKLINSDALYLQLHATLHTLEGVLADIKNYGLLFQYDKKWQRQRAAKMRQMEECAVPDGWCALEMHKIAEQLDLISSLLEKERNAPFFEQEHTLFAELEHLLHSLRNTNTTLFEATHGNTALRTP